MNKRSVFILFIAILTGMTMVAGCSKSPEVSMTLPTDPTAAGNVSDADVTEHVKTALQQNDALKGFDITVVTIKGDVRMTGVVDSRAQIDEAIAVARAADGVHAIHDELTIKK